MSHQELDRLGIVQAVVKKKLRQQDAAQQLGLSVRQVKRLVQRYRQSGAAGLVSRHRGKRPNNAISDATRAEVVTLVQKHYADFGPTLACEKLLERHEYTLSAETLRKWMITEGLWRSKRRRQAHIHQRRPRRPCRGELIQIDGSPHAWFEDRGPACTLIVFIDDATGELLGLRFAPTETTRAYMETLCDYLVSHGRPVALYSDKHSIFRVNYPERDGELTQFSRALKTLDIAMIHANTPQAKGRVERANQTLQDRLVKELRLEGINDQDAGNAFLPEFMNRYNARFAVRAQNPADAHRKVLHDADNLSLILSLHHHRTLSKNLTFQFRNREYQIQAKGRGYGLRGAIVTVCEPFNSQVTVLRKGKPLTYRLLAEGDPPAPLDDEKSVHHSVDNAKAVQAKRSRLKPRPDHPWKRQPVIPTQQPLS